MKSASGTILSAWVLGICLLLAASGAGADKAPRVKAPDHPALTVSGPFAHKNLAVYVLHLEEPQRRIKPKHPEYITLEEGVRSGLVTISEDDRETVQRLLVTNKSAKRLFLQVGELIRGGKQDRTLQTSLVIPPRTIDAPIPSFCVERSRWSGGKAFTAAGLIVPDRGLKVAIQSRSQGGVWKRVRTYKAGAREAMRRADTTAGRSRTSSINEELASGTFSELIDEYVNALKDAPNKYAVPLGLAYAVNGQVSTVDIYHVSPLFKKLFPKLLRSAAAEAAAAYTKGKRIVHPSLKQVSDFIAAAWDGKTQKQRLGLGNVYVRIFSARAVAGQLFFKDDLIHSQIVRKADGPKPPPKPIPLPRPVPVPQPRLPLPRR